MCVCVCQEKTPEITQSADALLCLMKKDEGARRRKTARDALQTKPKQFAIPVAPHVVISDLAGSQHPSDLVGEGVIVLPAVETLDKPCEFIISSNPGALDAKHELFAMLWGCYAMQAQTLRGEPGPVVKFTSALRTKRLIFIDPMFVSLTPITAKLMVIANTVARHHGVSEWTFTSDFDHWKTRKLVCKTAEVLAIVHSASDLGRFEHAAVNMNHVMTFAKFVKFVKVVDRTESIVGTCGY